MSKCVHVCVCACVCVCVLHIHTNGLVSRLPTFYIHVVHVHVCLASEKNWRSWETKSCAICGCLCNLLSGVYLCVTLSPRLSHFSCDTEVVKAGEEANTQDELI